MQTNSLPRFAIENAMLALGVKFVALLVTGLALFVILLIVLIIDQSHNLDNLDKLIQKNTIIEDIAKGNIWAIIYSISLGPLIETLVAQAFVIWLMSKITSKTKYLIISSALVFSLLHKDVISFIWLFAVGLVLAWDYLLMRKKGFYMAVLSVTLVHSLFNLATLIIDKLFGWI